MLVLAMGRPIGTRPVLGSRSATSYTQHPTTVSVGPYSLMILVAGALLRPNAIFSQVHASPPTTKHFVLVSRRSLAMNEVSMWRCKGVILTRLCPLAR